MEKLRSEICLIIFLLSLFPLIKILPQTFNVEGNVSTDSTTVKYAKVILIDQSDISKRYTAITDAFGNYQLNVVTDINDDIPSLPESFELGQNYPNPFSSATTIPYTLNKPLEVRLKIYDILGQEVKSFELGEQETGLQNVIWDGRNNFGNEIVAGIYFYQLISKGETQVKKMIFVKSIENSGISLNNNFVGKLRKRGKINIEPKIFTVNVLSSDSTNPTISPLQIPDVTIQSDTTMNFIVDTDTISLKVLLQKQTDHSGIMVNIVELDTFLVTDSSGRFILNNFDADGYYTLSAKYPYFKTEEMSVQFQDGKIITPVNLELQQLLQFWIEPAETTLSMDDGGNPNVFSFGEFRLWDVNISDEPVTVWGGYLPIYLRAIVPQDNEWPYVPNPDSLPNFCYLEYNWFGANDADFVFIFTLQPHDTSYTYIRYYGSIVCFQEGLYALYSAISDLAHYPEYFDPGYVFYGGDRKHLYEKMNRSLFKKLELFKPALVHLTN